MTDAVPRLLPWSSPDGKPAYVLGDGTGFVSRMADEVEEAQLALADGLIVDARRTLDARTWTSGELHLLTVELAESLVEVRRVARSRGDRLRALAQALVAAPPGPAVPPAPTRARQVASAPPP
ncbi:hypothetical protein [Streptomyces rhizoryzae]|uniref:hypothetical protein n=1 Tax=Streptomyces rhizoryzae TaxID=2932493 RepID=UPI0027E42C13|nr:hypothetical protein [Streptomyces rhizoryzae]